MMNYSEYSKWLDETYDLLKRFELLSRKVEAFMMEHFVRTKAGARLLATNIVEVLQNCDTVDYDTPGVVEAYVALHFLDRFHRFQLVFQTLLREKILPIKTLPIDVFDVGTGPAPALFALSDIYSSVNAFAAAANVRIPTQVVGNDYVEHSKNFRNWLHRFVEYANDGELRPWLVPYH
jgi:ribosomal protein RSM22 (predicted rRNA methylase)